MLHENVRIHKSYLYPSCLVTELFKTGSSVTDQFITGTNETVSKYLRTAFFCRISVSKYIFIFIVFLVFSGFETS